MNYPVWDVAFGAGLLMAVVSILHVFVSHFAVGGGLFLVLTERRARRTGDAALLSWLKFHTRFFVLLTLVFGAVSGVGIWFTMALINPVATSNLIHAFVWGWAIEWVFFFLEITAALLYYYGWNKLEPRLHEWYGWVYFAAAFASMVIINGILSFMLTPGTWAADHAFWPAFFNATYFPSLAVRFGIALALAGIYAVLTASFQKDAALKARLIRWSARWIVPAFLALVPLVWWYTRSIPAAVWTNARAAMPTATLFARLAIALSAVTFLAGVSILLKPARLSLARSLPLLWLALATMGSFEFVREAVRKPFAISGYLYVNSVYARPMPGDAGQNPANIAQAGILNTAKWVETRAISPADPARAGAEIFRVECASCHTVDGYRGMKRLLARRNWTAEETAAMLGSLGAMHKGAMPPFAGLETERMALAAYLAGIWAAPPGAPRPSDGAAIFQRHCEPCHNARSDTAVFATVASVPAADALEMLKNLPDLDPHMPNVKLSDQERASLVRWLASQAN